MRAVAHIVGGSAIRTCCLLLALFASTAPATAAGAAGSATGADLTAELDLIKSVGSSPANRAAAVVEGKNNASFCANCHGETGNSKYPEVPNLAGQNPAYLLAQMKKFETGERKDDFMQRLIKMLGDRERATVALYYAEARVTPAHARPGPRAAQGAAHYTRLCVRCHGDKALGSESVPRLAGQQDKYLRLSLDRYRSSSGERFFPQMTAATVQIPAADVDAVVDYLASMKH